VPERHQLPPIHLNPDGIADVPSPTDRIGFAPYVSALAWFLSSEETRPPLTVSIEGSWGAGKTSFMFQLKGALQQQGSKDHPPHFVTFNAWRSEKDEALWAAFALTLIEQLRQSVSFRKRLHAHLKLLWNRFDWGRGRWRVLQAGFGILLIATLATVTAFWPSLLTDTISNPTRFTFFTATWLAACVTLYMKLKPILGNPLSIDLGKYVKNPSYEQKISFIEHFQKDFAAIITSYVGIKGRIYVFIDDLDRCEVPRAADLMQAINLLLSTDQANLFFVIGLDREMVAAGIAAKHEKLLPFLAARRTGSKPISSQLVGMEYAYSYLEKFIQVPFRIPAMREERISAWVDDIVQAPAKVSPTLAPALQDKQPNPQLSLRFGSDPKDFELVVSDLAKSFQFNPRRLKQFINVFRLRIIIAVKTGVLVAAAPDAASIVGNRGITLRQLGLVTAIMLRWPQLIADLNRDSSALSKIAQLIPSQEIFSLTMEDRERLSMILQSHPAYSLAGIDLGPLLEVMPETALGSVEEGRDHNTRTSLVGAAPTKSDGPVSMNKSSGEYVAQTERANYSTSGTSTFVASPAPRRK